jgi:arylsulfatase A-like enzyme
MTRPNLIFLLADDLRADALGCMGHPFVQTPNLDSLARRGMVFTNAFVTTSICVASRANILTGQWMATNGIVEFADRITDRAWEDTYPARLRAAGYTTGFVGKFGIGDEAYVNSRSSRFDYWRGRGGQGGTEFIEPDGAHTTARFGEQCREFLGQQHSERPFCLSVSFNAPHARDGRPREFTPDPRDEHLYATTPIPRPTLATPEAFERLPASVKTSEARRRWEKRFSTEEQHQATVRDYLRLITGLDREVGHIVETLKERGLYENTVIVFTSDNGFALGERGLADKWFAYEEDIRVPLLVAGPGVGVGRSSALALSVDIAPTLLDLTGIPRPSGMQGRSLTPLLRAGRRPRHWRRAFYYEHRTLPAIIPPCEAVRTERFKYIRWLEPGGTEELYDLRKDPQERHNLVAEPRRARLLAEQQALCQRLRGELTR